MAIETAAVFKDIYLVEPTLHNRQQATVNMLDAMLHIALAVRLQEFDSPEEELKHITLATNYLLPEGPNSNGMLPPDAVVPTTTSERQTQVIKAFMEGDDNPLLQAFQRSTEVLSTLNDEDFTFLRAHILKRTPQEVVKDRFRLNVRLTNKYFDPQPGETWDENDEGDWPGSIDQANRILKYNNSTLRLDLRTDYLNIGAAAMLELAADGGPLDQLIKNALYPQHEVAKAHRDEDPEPEIYTNAFQQLTEGLTLVMSGDLSPLAD